MLAVLLRNPKRRERRGGHGAVAAMAGAGLLIVAASPLAASACPTPPPAIRDIDLPRYYADGAGVRIDEDLKAAHKTAVAPLKAYLARVTADADKAWQRSTPAGRTEAGRCAVTWLAAWARAGALTGSMASKQAEYQRKWDFTGAALAWLKVRAFADRPEQVAIDAWLVQLADAARAFFDDRGRKRNNHWYWLGLGLGATGLATGSDRHWQMARGIFDDAMRDIAADGTMAHELARGARALHYHDFSAMPLVVLADLAAARREDWTVGTGERLHRLAQLTLAGHADPALFDRLAGVVQVLPVRPPAGWPLVYAARYPGRRLPVPGATRPGHRWLGGNVDGLAAALRAGGR